MENQMKFVEFDYYCKRCKHRELDEHQDPCNECLDIPARENTRVPEHFEGETKT